MLKRFWVGKDVGAHLATLMNAGLTGQSHLASADAQACSLHICSTFLKAEETEFIYSPVFMVRGGGL